jgi:CubicO group peptidase (beta-lactamase class C family)
MRFRSLAILAVSLCFGCVEARQAPVERQAAAQSWIASRPEDVGLRTEALDAIAADIRSGRYGEIHAILVTRQGKLAYEAYFTGSERFVGESKRGDFVTFGPDRPHHIWSMTKSVTAMLVGIAIDQGHIQSVDEPLRDLLPRHRHLLTGSKGSLTLRHLLTMTTGISNKGDGWPRPFPAPDSRIDDPVAAVLAREFRSEPGTFNYNDGQAHVVGAVVEAATGRRLDEYAREVLFEPLGITWFDWRGDALGRPAAAWGLRLLPRDVARLGAMISNDGRWRGLQIVPEKWLGETMQFHVSVPLAENPPKWALKAGYGYLSWVDEYATSSGTLRLATAVGFGGQRISVVPEHDLALVVLAGDGEDPKTIWYPEMIFHRLIEELQ